MGILVIITLPRCSSRTSSSRSTARPAGSRTSPRRFPLQPLADGLQVAFDPRTQGSGIVRHDLSALAIWTLIGAYIMLRFLRTAAQPAPSGDARDDSETACRAAAAACRARWAAGAIGRRSAAAWLLFPIADLAAVRSLAGAASALAAGRRGRVRRVLPADAHALAVRDARDRAATVALAGADRDAC